MKTWGARLSVMLGLLLASTSGMPGAALAADAQDGAPQVQNQIVGDTFWVKGRFEVRKPLPVVWSVLTDYGRLAEFVSSLEESTVRSRRSDGAIVEQRAEAKAFVFSRTLHVLLDIHETPTKVIRFRDVSHRDFALYEGTWTLTQDGDAVQVEYQLRAKPRSQVPAFVASGAIKDNARALLGELRAEINERSN